MPLPSGGDTTWPPRNLQPVYAQYNVLDAWYEGNPDRLAAVYGDPTGNGGIYTGPSTFRGYGIGTGTRYFWGTQIPAGQTKRTKLHIPLASDLAALSAGLLYTEPPEITVQDEATQQRLDDAMEDLQLTLKDGAETGSALGGYYLRICWDKDIAEYSWLDVMHADSAVPEWRGKNLWAVTFWQVLEVGTEECLWHLERHEPGYILNGLYRGRPGDLGAPLPLTAHPQTKMLQAVTKTDQTRCTAEYIPNMTPSRMWRNYPGGRPLGRSDYEGPVMGLFDAVDETWSSWIRDLRLAKARLVIPRHYLSSNGPGLGTTFDLDQELYESLPGALGDDDRMEISPHQFAIRYAEHKATQDELIEAILRAAGYSAQSFGLGEDGVAVTATEVAAKERRSLGTRGIKAITTNGRLARLIESQLQIDVSILSASVTPERPQIVFGDSIAPDGLQLAQTAELLRRAEAASDETIVRGLHPDWDDIQVMEEVDKITAARPAPIDPFADPEAPIGEDGEPAEDADTERDAETGGKPKTPTGKPGGPAPGQGGRPPAFAR